MIVLGVTGGVGSGKSTVLNYIFENYNAVVLFCDDIAKDLIKNDGLLKQQIKAEFINYNIFDNNDDIDNSKLAEVVFSDKKMLNKLDGIVHPAVKKKILDLIDYYTRQNQIDVLIIEAALLLEEEYDKIFDCIYVHSDKNIRIKRLIDSRGYSKEKAISIMSNQLSEKVFRERCKHTINNNLSFKETCDNIDNVLSNFYGLRRKNVR